ncbi:MAG: 16S rRNA (cytidine(1402)-2'-O)-methyltransferase [Cellvibrionaceae bacterium]|nr:16S rRNA (cytidine(1402)-2'-O)-methyltransferase [Cellvibrionaceae bacterium]
MNQTVVNAAVSGHLYIVATPIGNLADISMRAIDTLRDVALIAAEDTRHSRRLLNHFNISTPVIAYHDYSDARCVAQIIDKLCSGQSIALISDAGTPMVSDPGYRLVRAAREQSITIVPVPGACAAVAALSAAGLPSDRWTFEGFLPAKTGARRQRLQALLEEERTLVFYESTHRIIAALEDMAAIFGRNREAVLARELTKTYETLLSGTLAVLIDRLHQDDNQCKGEFVLLVRGSDKPDTQAVIDAAAVHTMKVLLEELSVKQAAAIGAKLTGVKKRDLYQWALNLAGY